MLQIKANVRHVKIGTYNIIYIERKVFIGTLRYQNGHQMATQNIKFITFWFC